MRVWTVHPIYCTSLDDAPHISAASCTGLAVVCAQLFSRLLSGAYTGGISVEASNVARVLTSLALPLVVEGTRAS